MTGHASRGYAGEDDYRLMRSLLRAAYADAGPDVSMTVGDLDYWRFQSADPDAEMRSCRLWLDDAGAALGFAWPGIIDDGAGVIDLFAHPRFGGLLEPMLAWAERWHSLRPPGRVVTVNGLQSDVDGATALTRRGFRRSESFHHWYRVRPMTGPLPETPNVEGCALRSADAASDAAAVADTNNRSKAGPPLTAESCRRLMAAPTYRRDLHVIAETPERSTVLAFCIVWYDEANRVGLFEPVACDPAHRRRGLATAVMTDGLRRLQTLGATHALVACGGRNEPANALYASLGFEPRGLSWEWTKSIS